LSQPRRILYVDDDAGLRRLVQRALERRGFAVETADGADTALARLNTETFDLIAVDHHMPGKDGLTLLGEIAALPAAPPVVFVTGTDDTRVAIAALKSGAADFVIKAVGEDFFDLLANAFAQALEKEALLAVKTRIEEELREANVRLEALLGEVHHRVANSLQLVSSFVSLQASQAKDTATSAALAETQGRIQAISQVHRRLYTSRSMDAIELDAYLDTLIDALRRSLADADTKVELVLTAEPVTTKPDHAVSVGVIVTELVSNAAKYAFEPGADGRIEVSLRKLREGGFQIEVADNGCGFDPQEKAKGTGLGMRIVTAMARSLQSAVEPVATGRGSRFEMTVGAGSAG
jgi:two-component sensor histidine kinase